MANKEKTVLYLAGEIDLKADKAKTQMNELKDLLKDFQNKTIEVKAQTRSARMSIQNLGDFLNRTFAKDHEVKLNIGNAKSNLETIKSLLDYIKANKTITLTLEAKGVSDALKDIRSDIKAIEGKHNISFNVTSKLAKDQIQSLARDINKIKNVDFNIGVKNNLDLKNLDTFTKNMAKLDSMKKDMEFGIKVKSVENSLDRVNQVSNKLANLKNNNAINFTDNNTLHPILGKLKNLDNYLKSIKKNAKIKIEATGVKDINKEKIDIKADVTGLNEVERKLAIIRAMINQINRKQIRIRGNVNVNNRGGYSRYSNAEPADMSRTGNSAGLLGGNVVTDLTDLIHFIGRSSKGWGSLGEATADMLSKMNMVSGGFGTLMTAVTGTIAVVAGFAFAINAIVSVIGTLGRALGELANLIATALKPGFELMADRDTTMLTTKAALKTSATVDGRKVTDEEATAESLFLFNRAVKEAAKTVLNLKDIQQAQQGALPMLLNKGMTPRQAQDIIFGVAGVAKTGRLAPNQVLQETRDLAQGSITARSSQVANILGVTNQDLAKFKGDADALYDYLMEKFKEYSAIMEEYAKTPVGAIEQLQETWGIASMAIVDQYGPLIVGIANDITAALGSFDEQGNFQLSDWLKELAEGLEQIIVYAASCADAIFNMLQVISGGDTPIETITNFIIDMIGAFTTLVGIVLGIAEIFKGFWVVMKSGISILEAVTKAAIGVAQAIGAISMAASGNLNGAWDMAENARKNLVEAGQAGLNALDLKGQWNGTIQTGWTASDKKDGYKTFLGEKGEFTKYLEQKLNIGKNKELGKGKDYEKMRGNERNEEDEKARKKAIQDAQKIMKANIQKLKEALKDHIDQLKETLEKNKIAFDEGFMSIKEYYEQKAAIEREEAEAKLKEAQGELEWVNKTPYLNEADREKEQHKLNREINQYTRELGRAIKAQKEVADNIEKFTEVQKAVNTFMNGKTNISPKQLSSGGGYYYTDVSQLGEGAESLAKLASDLVRRAKELRGVDLDVGKLLGLFFAEVGREGNSRNWLENKNPAGFTANNATPDRMIDYGGGRGPGEGGDYETYANVTYKEMLDHIVNTWLKWYQKELQTGTSTAEMNAGMQGVFHAANVNRTSTYDAGVEYAKQHGLYNTMNEAANNLNEASSNLLSASGEMMGYIPEDQYSRAGMDTRYSAFQDMSSGVETQISGLNDNVKALFNLFAKRYFEKTGEKVLWTSFTGDMRNGGANNPHSSSEKGHRYGWKGDLWVSNNAIAAEIANELKLALGDEDDHLDLSAWGGVGGKALTMSSSAEELHDKLVSATQSINVLANTGLTDFAMSLDEWQSAMELINEKAPALGAIMRGSANETKTGHEAYVAFQNYLDESTNLRAGNMARVTGDFRAQIMQEMPKLFANIKKYRTDQPMLEQVFIEFNNKLMDKMTSFAKNMADFNLKVIEQQAEYRGTDMLSGSRSFKELFDMYTKYFTDIDNKLGIGKYIESLEKLYAEYEAKGFTQDAFEIREYLNNLKQRLVNMQKSWIDKIGEYYDRQQTLFDATPGFTNLQREFGTRELKAYKAQAEYEAYSIALDDINKQIDKNNKKLKTNQELVEKCAKGTKERAYYEGQVSVALSDSSRLDALKKEYEYQKKLNDLQREQPNYLRDLKDAAKQGLEDGLLTFLTDGITEAESLKDALLDMARTFLKSIQEISAKWIVDSLFNRQKQYVMEGVPNVSGSGSQAGVITAVNAGSGAIVGAINALNTALTGNTFGSHDYRFSTPTIEDRLTSRYTNGYTPYNSIFNTDTSFSTGVSGIGKQPQSDNNYSFDYASLGIQKLGESANMAGQQALPNFTQGLQSVSDNVANTNVATGAEQMATTMQTASTTLEASLQQISTVINGSLTTALQNLSANASSAASALSMIGVSGAGAGGGFATGGYISGPGTSTSDSIPAMLSNGEYVVKSSMVKRYGKNFLDSVNEGRFTKIRTKPLRFAKGGIIGDVVQDGTARGLSTFGKAMSPNINNSSTINVALVRDEQEGMKQLLKSAEGQRIMLDFSRKYASVTNKF